jgi:hypothetical protein
LSTPVEFERWGNTLDVREQVKIDRNVHLLQEFSPTLTRPHADVITQSRQLNLKELRGKVDERQLRVWFALDPRRTAILLIGGDKTGDPGWYVPIADDLFHMHLERLEKNRGKELRNCSRQDAAPGPGPSVRISKVRHGRDGSG